MSTNLSHNEQEYNRLIKILDFRLANSFKKIGLIGAIVIFTILLASKFFDMNSLIVKDVLRTLVLLFMLIASLSKDSFEDEFNNHIRFQSYVIAFVCAVGYSISIPLIALIFDILITNVSGDGTINFYKVSAFEVMFILLGFQLLFFETLKRFGRV